MPIVPSTPKAPDLHVVRRRTVDLDPDAAEMVRIVKLEAPEGNGAVTGRSDFLGMRSHAHLWGMVAGLLVVLWLAFTLLPRAW